MAEVENDRFYALWLLVATTGLRRGELAGLRRHDIDREHATVAPSSTRVVVSGRAAQSDPKTVNGERVVAIDPDTRDALQVYLVAWDKERELLGQSASGLLFVHSDGRPLHPDTITAVFHKHGAAAGLPRIRIHDVRHSAPIPTAAAAVKREQATVDYTVRRGDSLWEIAERLLGDGARYKDIVKLNRDVLNARPDFIVSGTVLKVPHEVAPTDEDGRTSEEYVLRPADTLSEIAEDELGDQDAPNTRADCGADTLGRLNGPRHWQPRG